MAFWSYKRPPLGCSYDQNGAGWRSDVPEVACPAMRVVAGSARGLRLDAPPGHGTRPTSDRVREAIFNSLHSGDLVVDAAVLDLFAGSGALGIEALSRGAAHATFVESDRAALATLRANIQRCGLTDRATVVASSAERFLDRSAVVGRPFDLALLDPPYAFDAWSELLRSLDAATLVVESDREVEIPARWDVMRHRAYGSTVVQIATRSPRSR